MEPFPHDSTIGLDENDEAKVCYHSFLPLESLDMLLDSGSHFDSFSKFFFRSKLRSRVPVFRILLFGLQNLAGQDALVKRPWSNRPGTAELVMIHMYDTY